MGITIKGKILSPHKIPEFESKIPDISSHLKNIGIFFDETALSRVTFYIELKELPEIITQLKIFGYPWGIEKDCCDISDISENGLTLYTVQTSIGEGFDATIFIPMHNIIAIHTIEDKSIDELRMGYGSFIKKLDESERKSF